jgi:hypothetical protein
VRLFQRREAQLRQLNVAEDEISYTLIPAIF